jgi:hypothetical protein
VAVHGGLPLPSDHCLVFRQELRSRQVHDVIIRARQPAFEEEVQEAVVAPVPIDEHDLAQSVACGLCAHLIQQTEHQIGRYGDRARHVARFEDLREVDVREDHRRLSQMRETDLRR